ncbi:MAG: response regulator [Gammaproteobacteria bacterium]|nr:response regulator [Gammaproteobacteria bacterium]
MLVATKNILVVDDDEDCRIIARRILTRAGYTVDTACDGAEGLQKAQARQFDLILLDVMMPKLDGFEVCARIRREKPNADTPVVMVTALDSMSDQAKATESGAQWMVNKPYDSRYLVSVANHRIAPSDASLDARQDSGG